MQECTSDKYCIRGLQKYSPIDHSSCRDVVRGAFSMLLDRDSGFACRGMRVERFSCDEFRERIGEGRPRDTTSPSLGWWVESEGDDERVLVVAEYPNPFWYCKFEKECEGVGELRTEKAYAGRTMLFDGGRRGREEKRNRRKGCNHRCEGDRKVKTPPLLTLPSSCDVRLSRTIKLRIIRWYIARRERRIRYAKAATAQTMMK